MKFFVYGIVLGVLFAPRSGDETREQVMGWANTTIKEMLGGITGGS